MKRIGVVKYLNAKPLVFGLESCPEFELIFDVPSKLAVMLADGQLDIGLIPSIEYFRFGSSRNECSYSAVPGISISSKGKVLSVKLFCKKPISEIEKVALDTSSRTSVALVKIILKERFDVQPAFVERDPTKARSWTDIDADAVLIIGDWAMQVSESKLMDDLDRSSPHPSQGISLDLGEEWRNLTGLPFVYAFWTARTEKGQDTSFGEVVAILQKAKSEGLKNVPQIAARESRRLRLEEDLCKFYLGDVMSYDFGEDEIRGVMKFYDYTRAMALAPDNAELKFL